MDLENMPHVVPVCRISIAQIVSHARRAKCGSECPFEPASPLWKTWHGAHYSASLSLGELKLTSKPLIKVA